MRTALTPKDMAYCDRMTIEGGVPSRELMYRVAYSVFAGREWEGKIYIICGKGNNGGDGFALANILLDNGKFPYVYLTDSPSTPDAVYYYGKLIERSDVQILDIEDCDYRCDAVVDCIFGTGFRGTPDGKYKSIIDRINTCGAFILSVDVPSGLNGENGVGKICVHADETVTVQYAKSGLYLNDGKDATGKVSVCDVGIGLYCQPIRIVEDCDVEALFPKRKRNTHKGSYGKSAIMGGCVEYTGAVKLAETGLCALRCGGGLNALIVPSSIIYALAPSICESTLLPMSESEGYLRFDKDRIDEMLNNVDALAIGMGMGGRYEENLKIIDYVIKNYAVKVLIDADGLNSLSLDIDILLDKKADVILTPHVKEMARLCGVGADTVIADPIGIAKEFAAKYRVTVLLKGASTVITDGEQIYMVVNGGAELAKGGSGDTLSGVALGMLSQGYPLIESAYSAAYLTAYAANKLCSQYSEYGVLPSDVAKAIATIVSVSKNN